MASTHLTDVMSVAIPVTDHDRSIAFYTETLDLEVVMDAVLGEGMRWAQLSSAGAHTHLALVATGDGLPTGVDTGIRLATTDAEADFAAFGERGVDLASELLRWEGVPPMFSFRDPDGNTLYVVQG
jgi:predicted enzyme related to lactoylglutathione lyase